MRKTRRWVVVALFPSRTRNTNNSALFRWVTWAHDNFGVDYEVISRQPVQITSSLAHNFIHLSWRLTVCMCVSLSFMRSIWYIPVPIWDHCWIRRSSEGASETLFLARMGVASVFWSFLPVVHHLWDLVEPEYYRNGETAPVFPQYCHIRLWYCSVGSLTLILHDDKHAVLSAGDVIVQRGITHGWGTKWAHVFFVSLRKPRVSYPL